MSGIFHGPGQGTRYTARGSEMTFKAIAASTGGAFSLMERTIPASGRRPPPHRHAGPEGFYILDGSIEMVIDGRSQTGGPGFWALAPAGAAHTFGNAGDTPARLLIIHAPAADGYFEGLQRLWASQEPPTPEEERELMRSHGIEPVEP